ncbi:type II toxin-antitoxin system MqsR family toxin [Marinospirillum sp. MEB164]|uniref:Type II toxin-antitoxin system MqsR family toxin n=1 Tax=Marinospirillum alkalitolerans TaxID=3123374 RepID=A0ABW8PZ81_9GAMM
MADHNPQQPFFDLKLVKEAAAREDIEYERKVRKDIANLGYELSDVILCLQGLKPDHFHKSHAYNDQGYPLRMDAYVYTYTWFDKNEDEEKQDKLYIKFSLVNGKLLINLASFHLSS